MNQKTQTLDELFAAVENEQAEKHAREVADVTADREAEARREKGDAEYERLQRNGCIQTEPDPEDDDGDEEVEGDD